MRSKSVRVGVILTWGNVRRRVRGASAVPFNVVVDVIVNKVGAHKARTS